MIRRLIFNLAALFLFVFLPNTHLSAETATLIVAVKDMNDRPVFHLTIGVEGDGTSDETDRGGKARIHLAPQDRPGEWVTLNVLRSPAGKNLVIVSPWDSRTMIPSFENKSRNVVSVWVAPYGDKTLLANGRFLADITSRIMLQATARPADQEGKPELAASLAVVARAYGLDPDVIDKAIRAWGAEATDPRDAGLAALYEKNYVTASHLLKGSRQRLEKQLSADAQAVAENAFFLGQSLDGERKYGEAAVEFKRCLELRPGEPAALAYLGVSLMNSGNDVDAEITLRQAIEALKNVGAAELNLGDVASNLSRVLRVRGKEAEAQEYERQVVKAYKSAQDMGYQLDSRRLNTLALTLQALGRYEEAGQYYRLAINLDRRTSDDQHRAIVLNNLAGSLVLRGNTSDFPEAQHSCEEALAINEGISDPADPEIARNRETLSSLYEAEDDYAKAEFQIRLALDINKRTYGPQHQRVADDLHNLAVIRQDQGDYGGAKAFYQQAIDIDERALGADAPTVSLIRAHLQSAVDAEAASRGEK